jgi:hypothetical protein
MAAATDIVTICDNGVDLDFSFDDMLRYHGPGFPGGVAHAFKVMQRGLTELAKTGPVSRRDICVDTSFGGPGGRDAFELVTRAVTEGRYNVDKSLGEPFRDGTHRERYFFCFRDGDRSVEMVIRGGHVRDEFIALGAKADKTPEEVARHNYLKQEMADRLLALPAEEICDIL